MAEPLHRIATIRRKQGMSLDRAARHLGRDARSVLEQEVETSDLRLSELLAWQRVLEVPLTQLLVQPPAPVSPLDLKRARLVRLRKTAVAIRDRAPRRSTRRMAMNLVRQLSEILADPR